MSVSKIFSDPNLKLAEFWCNFSWCICVGVTDQRPSLSGVLLAGQNLWAEPTDLSVEPDSDVTGTDRPCSHLSSVSGASRRRSAADCQPSSKRNISSFTDGSATRTGSTFVRLNGPEPSAEINIFNLRYSTLRKWNTENFSSLNIDCFGWYLVFIQPHYKTMLKAGYELKVIGH